MTDTRQWLVVALAPLAISIVILGVGVLLLPLGGTLGVVVGLTSTSEYFSIGFKSTLLLGLLGCALMSVLGYRLRHKFWGKAIMSLSVYVWCGLGLIGFGPQ